MVRITPQATKTTWEHGKEVVSYQKSDFIVHCAYHGTDASFVIFDIEVINNSPDDYLVAPENFVMYPDSGKWDPITNQTVYAAFPVRAMNPEDQLLKLDLQQSATEASMKNQQTAAAVLAIAAVPVIIASAVADANDTEPREVSRTDVTTTTTIGVIGGLDAGQEADAQTLDAVRSIQKRMGTIRPPKTTISQGEARRRTDLLPPNRTSRNTPSLKLTFRLSITTK
ncbi:MAG: hypothetical protein H6536_05395 [Bacteroidales bacterium]|nr:hypothetical protein [Bacteroidales bacterium]